mgnify:CR=1 FL=1
MELSILLIYCWVYLWFLQKYLLRQYYFSSAIGHNAGLYFEQVLIYIYVKLEVKEATEIGSSEPDLYFVKLLKAGGAVK